MVYQNILMQYLEFSLYTVAANFLYEHFKLFVVMK